MRHARFFREMRYYNPLYAVLALHIDDGIRISTVFVHYYMHTDRSVACLPSQTNQKTNPIRSYFSWCVCKYLAVFFAVSDEGLSPNSHGGKSGPLHQLPVVVPFSVPSIRLHGAPPKLPHPRGARARAWERKGNERAICLSQAADGVEVLWWLTREPASRRSCASLGSPALIRCVNEFAHKSVIACGVPLGAVVCSS